jgi:DNA-directed RNA polymerase specialized sigma24 family protein
MHRSALTVAEDAFGLLVCQPAPLAFDGRPISGLPDRHLPLDELRSLLLTPTCDPETSDAVWRQLAHQARAWGPAWVVGAVGVALPGLTRLAARLSSGYSDLADDIDSELLAGFLHALRSDDLHAPRVWLRLCWAAWRAGHKARHVEDLLELPADLPTGSHTPHRPYGHPDLILGRAVAAKVITQAQADLIAATRLGDVLIEQIAAECGVPGSVIRMRRKRAERTLVAALERGDLAVPRTVGCGVRR